MKPTYEKLYNSCRILLTYVKVKDYEWDPISVAYLRHTINLARKLCIHIKEKDDLEKILSSGVFALYRLTETPTELRLQKFIEWSQVKNALIYAETIISLFSKKEIIRYL